MSVISIELHEYRTDCNLQTRAWKISEFPIFYIYTMWWYDKNSKDKLQPEL